MIQICGTFFMDHGVDRSEPGTKMVKG